MRAIFVGLLLATSAWVWPAEKAQTLNVKPGLWETTMTTTTSGEMPISAELLSKMTPEQRAKMEQRMKANSGEKSRTVTYKSCLTKEQIDKGLDFDHEQGKCIRTATNSSSGAIDQRIACANDGANSSGTMHFEAPSPESIKGSGETNASGGGHSMTVRISFTSKYIGPTCGNED